MKEKVTYPNIDMEMTGLKLKRLISNAGYEVKDIQNHLHLSCPQPSTFQQRKKFYSLYGIL